MRHTTSTPVSVSLRPQLFRKINRTNENFTKKIIIGNKNKIHHWQDGEVWSGRLLLASNWDILVQVKNNAHHSLLILPTFNNTTLVKNL